MTRLIPLFALLSLAFFASLCASLPSRHSLNLPEGWSLGERAHPKQQLQMHLGIRQQNTAQLERILFAVSSPSSPEYGRHLSFEEVNELVAPSSESLEAVYGWLASHGIDGSRVEPNTNGDMLRFDVTVEEAEALLNAAYVHVHHTETGKSFIRTAQFELPENIAEHLDFVGPTTRLPFHPHVRLSEETNEALFNTPSSLRNLYNVGSTTATSGKSQLSVTGFLEQYISPTDLQNFFSSYDPKSVGRTATIVGPNKENNPGVEASLDIQYSMALGAGDVKATFWSTAGRAPNNKENEPFLAFLYDVSNTTNPPQVFSISYGDNEDTVDLDYAVRISTEFQKGGVRGITFLASSGDGGVAGSQSTVCSKFIPTFPAASPYITAVGGTRSSGPEAGWSYSSGGFSNYWNRPTYQESFVSQYFQVAQNLPPQSHWNRTGAGFPDISAQSVSYLVVIGGAVSPVDGTSCSSPTVAGIISLLNDKRLAAGKSTLGYLNPLFYEHPEAFNDVTSGNNPGCGTDGFYAAKGWDPITGLGTPNFEALSQLVESLP